LTFDWTVPRDLAHKPVTWGGKLLEETYSEYQKEMDLINRAFIEVLIEGDMRGRPFTFPIPTYNLTRDFNWENGNAQLLFDMTAKYGLPYFSNFINSDLNPSDVRSMCCRLRLNLRQLDRNVTGGLFGSGDSTGSVGVVSINMPRIAYLSKNKSEFLERLEYLMGLAKSSLETKREIVEKNMQGGLLPYTKRYLGTLKNHFSTIGPIGMNEACLNLLGEDIASPEGRSLAIETLEFMRKKLQDFQEETSHIYNLEAVPAEGVSYRLPRIDKRKYPDIIAAGKEVPYYTNSTLLPVGKTEDVIEALEHQEELQTLYTGGTVFHVFLGERMSSGEAAKRLLKKIAYNSRIPYITITPTYSICPDHGYLIGEHSKCLTCGKVCDVYSRVVGYFRPVRNWNKGKQEEFKQRLEYKEKIALEKDFSEKRERIVSSV
jgi:ribonucleoside-triphosphate reductase